jgi:hypothetical protein
MTNLVLRRRAVVSGEVTRLVSRSHPGVQLDVHLSDGTGAVTLRFLGRTELPGVQVGMTLVAEGTPARVHGDVVILNPVYSFDNVP